jgi:hypothetical protein
VLTAFCQSLKIHDYSCNSPLVVPSLLLTVIDGLLLIDREYRRIKAKLVVKMFGTRVNRILSSSQKQYHAYLELDCLCIIAEESKGANSISN